MGAPELLTLALVVAMVLTPPILLVRWLTRRSHSRHDHPRGFDLDANDRPRFADDWPLPSAGSTRRLPPPPGHCTDAGCPFAAFDHPAH